MKEIIFELLSKNVGVNISIEDSIKVKQYIEDLEDDRKLLYALEAAGVDNWTWYGEAMKIYNEEEE